MKKVVLSVMMSTDYRGILIALCAALLFIGCGEPNDNYIYMNGTLEQVRQRVRTLSDINALDETGRTILMHAASQNPNVEVIKFLISAGADIHTESNSRAIALHFAAVGNSNPEVLKTLISAGSNVNHATENGTTALMGAAWNSQNVKIVKSLVVAGAMLNARDNLGSTALMLSARNNPNVDITRVLIEAGANVNAIDDFSMTVLDKASNNKNPDVRRALLQGGAVDYMLYRRCSLEELQQHLREGAQVNAKDEGGITPLMQAASENPHSEVIRALIDAGADPNARDAKGRTPLMYVGLRFADPDPEIVKELLAVADPNVKDFDGRTTFSYFKSKSDAIKNILIKASASPDNVSIKSLTERTSSSIEELVKCLESSKPGTESCVQALVEIGEPSVIPLTAALLRTKEVRMWTPYDFSVSVGEVLGKLSSDSSIAREIIGQLVRLLECATTPGCTELTIAEVKVRIFYGHTVTDIGLLVSRALSQIADMEIKVLRQHRETLVRINVWADDMPSYLRRIPESLEFRSIIYSIVKRLNE
jgi:ankyrin repeat protein